MSDIVKSNPSINLFDKEQFETIQRVCKMYANSELVPDMYRSEKVGDTKAAANCIIALEIASRIGASALMVMQNMTPIFGKPSWSSKFLIATVNSCGRFEGIKYRIRDLGELGPVEYVDYKYNAQTKKKEAITKTFNCPGLRNLECVAFSKEKGSEDILESSPVTVKLAIQEGWWTKSGSKWPTMTHQMLQYRAASMWTNVYAPDLSMGIRTVEEVRDIEDVEYIDITPEKEDKHIGFNDAPQEPAKEEPKQPEPKQPDAPKTQEELFGK